MYVDRFVDPAEHQRVEQMVTEHFPLSASFSTASGAADIDDSVPSLLRVGSVYLECGGAAAPERQAFVHTPTAKRLLEGLACAIQSGRMVLLEGPTAAGKTSLVRHLAALARRPLLVLPMHHDIEVADLLGQWLPVRQENGRHQMSHQVDRLLRDFARYALFQVVPLLKERRADFSWVLAVVYQVEGVLARGGEADLPDHLGICTEVARQLGRLDDMHVAAALPERIMSHPVRAELAYLRAGLAKLNCNVDRGLAFVFVESAFLRAIRNGRCRHAAVPLCSPPAPLFYMHVPRAMTPRNTPSQALSRIPAPPSGAHPGNAEPHRPAS